MIEKVRNVYLIMLSGHYRINRIEFRRSVPHLYYESWPLQRGYKYEGILVIGPKGIELLDDDLAIWNETWWQFTKRKLLIWWLNVWTKI